MSVRRSIQRSPNADAHERAENRLLRKVASLHKEKLVMAHKPEHRKPEHKGKHANHESKAEHRKAGKSESRAEHVRAGKDAHRKGGEGHKAEHKMAEVHVHHHHHHHGKGAK